MHLVFSACIRRAFRLQYFTIMAEKYCIGIDLGATNIKLGLVRNDKIIYKYSLPTRNFGHQAFLIEALCKNIAAILSEKGIPRKDVSGVGIGVPGPVDFARGIVRYFPNIKGWKNVPLRKIMRQKVRMPVYIDNDANLMSLAEARLGAAKGEKNVIGLTLGTGVGAGIMINGGIYRGASFAAGEMGHIPLNERGPRCNCGGAACLERYIGNRYILQNAKKVFGKNITLEEVSRLAKAGNKKAARIWDGVAMHLGIGLSGVINFFNPGAVVIGGGVSHAGRLILDKVRRVVRERAMPTHSRAVKILKARLGNDAGMIGAALLVQQEFSGNA